MEVATAPNAVLGASAQLKSAIQKAAKENGRSLSAEMEARLERSFSDDATLKEMRRIIREELDEAGLH